MNTVIEMLQAAAKWKKLAEAVNLTGDHDFLWYLNMGMVVFLIGCFVAYKAIKTVMDKHGGVKGKNVQKAMRKNKCGFKKAVAFVLSIVTVMSLMTEAMLKVCVPAGIIATMPSFVDVRVGIAIELALAMWMCMKAIFMLVCLKLADKFAFAKKKSDELDKILDNRVIMANEFVRLVFGK